MRTYCQHAARRFHHIARPDKVVTAQVIVALAESPGDREAGDETTRRRFGFVSTQNSNANPGQIAAPLSTLLQRGVRLHPLLPAVDIVLLCFVKAVAHAGDYIACRRLRIAAKAERQNEISLQFAQIDSARQGHVAVFRPRVLPSHLLVRLEVVPAVGRTHVAN